MSEFQLPPTPPPPAGLASSPPPRVSVATVRTEETKLLGFDPFTDPIKAWTGFWNALGKTLPHYINRSQAARKALRNVVR